MQGKIITSKVAVGCSVLEGFTPPGKYIWYLLEFLPWFNQKGNRKRQQVTVRG